MVWQQREVRAFVRRGNLTMMALRRWAIRIDVVLGFVAVVVLTGVAFWELPHLLAPVTPGAETRGLISAVFAGWVAVVLACLGGIVKITSARQNLVRLFTSEIRALQYGLGQMDMFAFWASAYEHAEKGAMGFADTPRDEDYFAVFHSAIGNIANLHPNVVEAIVRFYTYLKMSRDAAAALATWEEQREPSVRRLHVTYVVRLLSLSMVWGYVARWYMGDEADAADKSQYEDMVAKTDSVTGIGSFAAMKQRHPRNTALDAFFATG
jgi:hypothetical protein